MDFEKFKENMFNKLIIKSDQDFTFRCPSEEVDTSTGRPDTVMTNDLIQLRQRISLICDIIAEYDKQKSK